MNAALGTLLVKRLDAMLGAPLSQQSILVPGTRPSAVSQTGQTVKGAPVHNTVQRHPQESVDRVAGTAQQTVSRAATAAPASVQLRLGAAARLILDLLEQYPQRLPVRAPAPLLATPAGQAAAGQATVVALLRQALVQAVEHSGMFYEAHLGQWLRGRRSLTSLRAEPQAQASARRAPGSVPSSATTATPDAASTVSLLLRQQLEVLARQAFAWQGQAWPGADMEWEIQRHPSRASPAQAPESWASVLSLQLPTLGRVDVRLALAGSEVAIHVQAPEGAPILQRHAGVLRQRLSAAGLGLRRLSITAQIAPRSATAPPAKPTAPTAPIYSRPSWHMPDARFPHEPHRAADLRHDVHDAAPQRKARGYGSLAETIIRSAQAHGLPVRSEPELVGLLQQVDLDAHVPPQIYGVVAELLAWLYALEGETTQAQT